MKKIIIAVTVLAAALTAGAATASAGTGFPDISVAAGTAARLMNAAAGTAQTAGTAEAFDGAEYEIRSEVRHEEAQKPAGEAETMEEPVLNEEPADPSDFGADEILPNEDEDAAALFAWEEELSAGEELTAEEETSQDPMETGTPGEPEPRIFTESDMQPILERTGEYTGEEIAEFDASARAE